MTLQKKLYPPMPKLEVGTQYWIGWHRRVAVGLADSGYNLIQQPDACVNNSRGVFYRYDVVCIKTNRVLHHVMAQDDITAIKRAVRDYGNTAFGRCSYWEAMVNAVARERKQLLHEFINNAA